MGLDTSLFAVFLGGVALLQAWLPARGRVALLLCASAGFYAWSSAGDLALLLALCGLNYWSLWRLKHSTDPKGRAWVFGGTVLANLAVLIVFKYAGGALNLTVPLGLSYITFQMLACVTDAYRRTWQLREDFGRFALFGLFFPQITSGPIPRAGRLLPQLDWGGSPTAEDRLAGLRLIAYGLFKKLVVANRLAEYVSAVFQEPPAGNSLPVLAGCCFNALQLYADFSGYVDIAIGSARVLGIRLDPNFDRPYASTSVTEFWRRWHMSLSFWLRDYLYLPLVIRIRNLGKWGIMLALVFTFAVCGLWHGARWTYLWFGVAQGLAMSVEFASKGWRGRRVKRWPGWMVSGAGNFYALGFFVLSQVLFRSANLAQAGTIYARLLHFKLNGGIGEALGAWRYFFSLSCAAVAAWLIVVWFLRRTSDRLTPWFVALCGCCIVFLGGLASGHFIYAAF